MLSQKATILSIDSIERFRLSLSVRGKSDQTSKAYSTDLRVFLTDLERTEIPQEEFEEIAMNWLTYNRRRIAAKTTGRRLTSLRQFSKWAGWGDLLKDYSAPTPLRGVPHPLPEGMDGVRKMVNAATRDSHKALVVLCGMLGLRVAEALYVKPSHFNFEEKSLTVYGKGNKERTVPVSTEAWEILQRPVTRAFCAGDIEVVGLKDRFARRVITNLAERAKLKRSVASHDLRATFATAVYNKTLDQRLVQELLGHSSGTTTEIYIERSKTQRAEGVEDL